MTVTWWDVACSRPVSCTKMMAIHEVYLYDKWPPAIHYSYIGGRRVQFARAKLLQIVENTKQKQIFLCFLLLRKGPGTEMYCHAVPRFPSLEGRSEHSLFQFFAEKYSMTICSQQICEICGFRVTFSFGNKLS